MPQSYDEIIRQILSDPSLMEGTMSGGLKPNSDMVFNPQQYDAMLSPNSYNLRNDPRDILDPVAPNTRMDDTKTAGQRQRTTQENLQNQMVRPKTPSINPDAQGQNDFDSPPPPPEASVNASPMQQLYNRMPQRTIPPSMMPQIPPEQQVQNNSDMQQLMEFYQGGGQVEM